MFKKGQERDNKQALKSPAPVRERRGGDHQRQDRQIVIVGETEVKVGEHLLMVLCRCEILSSWISITVFRKNKSAILTISTQ